MYNTQFFCLTVILAILLITPVQASSKVWVQEITTRETYGQNIVYYDFSKIPFDSLILDQKISPPTDLQQYFDDNFNNPRIRNEAKFEKIFWKEANRLGLTANDFQKMNPFQAILSIVKIVSARFTYYDVDKDSNFIKRYGEHLPIEDYFEIGLGDCDKYRDATLAAFKVIKSLNPSFLQNIYLTNELGGNHQPHAWVAIVIIQKDQLILSHIDPTFFDNGGKLETDNFHINLKNKLFLARFYQKLVGYENQVYAYQIYEKCLPSLNDDKELESVLDEMSFLALIISIYKPKVGLEKILPIIKLYEKKKFNSTLDALLYRAYKIYCQTGDSQTAEIYRQKLLTNFPHSFWSKQILNETQ